MSLFCTINNQQVCPNCLVDTAITVEFNFLENLFTESQLKQSLNVAIFDAFDEDFDRVSPALAMITKSLK